MTEGKRVEHQDIPFLKEFKILRFHGDEVYPADDVAAREEPLEIRLNGRTLVYLMRMPGDDRLLAAGFCLSEGIIQKKEQIELLRHCADEAVLEPERPVESDATPGSEGSAVVGDLVEIEARLAGGEERFNARVVRTGCGGADLAGDVDLAGLRVEADATFSLEVIKRIPDLLLKGQRLFQISGGTHAAGLFDSSGSMLVVKEDVGRHNAVDKVLGFMLMSGESPADKGLMLSGRLSYEMVLKAARAGVPVVCSVSAPTALGIEVAVQTGVTLVGFLRNGSFNVYSHPERIGGR
jgi:FdhD protein